MEVHVLKYLPSDIYNLKEHPKVYTYQILSRIGCPVLKSVLIEESDILSPEIVDDVAMYLGSRYCTVRYQYTKPDSKPVRGGNKVALLYDVLIDNRVPDTVLWLLEPTNRLTNIYGINLFFNRNNENLRLECVGKGFDASDLNRGDMNPHQSIDVQLPIEYGWYSEWWKYAKFEFISESRFKDCKYIRLEKLKNLGYYADGNIFDLSYKPISLNLFEHIMRYTTRIYDDLIDENDFVVSCSVLENCRIIFWDIATPKGKIKTFIGK